VQPTTKEKKKGQKEKQGKPREKPNRKQKEGQNGYFSKHAADDVVRYAW
jgi:hypothetical protein